MGLLTAPRVALSWSATALGASFAAYRIYRRPARAVAVPWVQIAELGVPAGYAAATVEAQHTRFVDYEAGWANAAGGQWADGWSYAVTVVDATTLVESSKVPDTLNVVTFDVHPWLVSNAAPYLNHPLPRVSSFEGADRDTLTAYPVAGRDLQVTRARLELPGREYRVGWDDFGGPTIGNMVGEDMLRLWRAAAASGRKVCVHRPLGDRVIGAISPAVSARDAAQMLYLAAQARVVETSRDLSAVAGYNLPAGLVLNGSSQYVTTPDNVALDPASSAFTVFCAAAFAGAGSSKYALSKGNGAGAADGYFIRSTGVANELQFRVDGASAAVNVAETNAAWFDGNVHVAVGTTSGTAQALYRDGAATPVGTGSTTHGAVANAVALVAGADNAGGSAFMACAPLVAWGVYMRQLTAAEAQALAYYLLGYPGWRPPPGPAVFYDLRDARTWNGIGTAITDLAGSGLAATVAASPATRGVPWPLETLDRF